MFDTFVRYIALPSAVRGFVVDDADGNHNIYINENLCDDVAERTYHHEMQHIEKGHLQSLKTAIECEEDIQ